MLLSGNNQLTSRFRVMTSFNRLDNHADAARAITNKHGSQLEGYTIKCSWGKEGASSMQQQMPPVSPSNNSHTLSCPLYRDLWTICK